MQKIFETLVTSFIKNEVGISKDFLNKSLSSSLKKHLLNLYNTDLMLLAKTGNNNLLMQNHLVRNDKIYWLDKVHDSIFERDFFNVIDDFISYLNSTCYTGITGYEFHFAIYEKGSFYKKHIDQFQNNKDRAYSMIIYLNDEWKIGDGGELCLHHSIKNLQLIKPISGQCVFFNSNKMEHEVLITQVPRLSITGWLKTN